VCRLSGLGLTCPSLENFVQGRAFIGDGLATLGAIGFAAYMLIGRRLRSKLSLIPYIFLAYSAAAITLIIAVILAGQSFFGYSPLAYIWLALLAVVPQLIGHSAFNWALRYVPATFVTITTLGEPIGSTVLALFIFQEIPTPLKLIGGGLILIGIVLASKPSAKTSEV